MAMIVVDSECLEAAGKCPKSHGSGQVSRRLQNASTNWVDL